MNKSELDSQKVCVYCYGIWDEDTYVCPTCNEYDGLIEYSQAVQEGAIEL